MKKITSIILAMALILTSGISAWAWAPDYSTGGTRTTATHVNVRMAGDFTANYDIVTYENGVETSRKPISVDIDADVLSAAHVALTFAGGMGYAAKTWTGAYDAKTNPDGWWDRDWEVNDGREWQSGDSWHNGANQYPQSIVKLPLVNDGDLAKYFTITGAVYVDKDSVAEQLTKQGVDAEEQLAYIFGEHYATATLNGKTYITYDFTVNPTRNWCNSDAADKGVNTGSAGNAGGYDFYVYAYKGLPNKDITITTEEPDPEDGLLSVTKSFLNDAVPAEGAYVDITVTNAKDEKVGAARLEEANNWTWKSSPLPFGYYYVTEAPSDKAGAPVDGELTKTAYVSLANTVYPLAVAFENEIIPDEPAVTEFSIDKYIGEIDNPGAGFVFDVYAADGDEVLASATSGEDGHVAFTITDPALTPGSYLVREQQLEGFDPVDDLYFTVAEDGTVTFDTVDYIVNIPTVTYTEFVLHKYIGEYGGEKGEGFTFDLYAEDGTYIDTKTSDENGEIVFLFSPKLPEGNYYVREVAADGYYQAADVQFAIDEDGAAVFAVVEDITQNFFVNVPTNTTVELQKYVGEYGKAPNGQAFTFDLFTAEALAPENTAKPIPLYTATNDAEGLILFSITPALPAGDYVIRERAADGYVTAADVTFSIDEAGEVRFEFVDDIAQSYFVNVPVAPTVTRVELLKYIGTYGGAVGEGFTFDVIKDGEVIKTATSDANGRIAFEFIPKLAAGGYIVRERAAEGYEQPADIAFTVNADGVAEFATVKYFVNVPTTTTTVTPPPIVIVPPTGGGNRGNDDDDTPPVPVTVTRNYVPVTVNGVDDNYYVVMEDDVPRGVVQIAPNEEPVEIEIPIDAEILPLAKPNPKTGDSTQNNYQVAFRLAALAIACGVATRKLRKRNSAC